MSCADVLSFVRSRHVEDIAISSHLLDALMSRGSSSSTTSTEVVKSKSLRESSREEAPTQVQKRQKDDNSSQKSNNKPIDVGRSPDSRKCDYKTPRRDRNADTNKRQRSIHSSSSKKAVEMESSLSKNKSAGDRSLEGRRHSPVEIEESPVKNVTGSKLNHSPDSNVDEDKVLSRSNYVTPEGTPTSQRSSGSKDGRSSSCKRSFSYEQQEESHSNNSSFYTPESSPRTHNSAKRQKMRWSDSSAFGPDSSSYSSWRHNTSCSSEQGIQPELIGYQMVGDSQFCRFGQQLLGLQRVPAPNSCGRIGICVSGQTITDLHKRVRENFYPISEKIILMIGTNDFLKNVSVSRMCEELSALIKTLQKSTSTIILLTLPPIPKLAKKNNAHFQLLDAYNKHIRSLEDGKTVRVADVSPLYMTSPPHQRCRMHLFELFFGGGERRQDLIHLNRLGLEVIRKYILDKYL